MHRQTADLLFYAQITVQKISMALIIGLACFGLVACGLAALSVWPWLEVPVSLAGSPVPDAGLYIQTGLTALAVALCFFLPSNTRMQKLEHSHRDFTIATEDVARAYALCHAADRSGHFKLRSEFDAVRERMTFMTQHPDLSGLEVDALQLAAQMSLQSQGLADLYSDEKVARAKAFLTQRQQEVALMNSRLEEAKQKVQELTRWANDTDLEASVLRSQLSLLTEDLNEALAPLGFDLSKSDKVVSLPRLAGE